MGDADPEDTKSLDSIDGMALAGEENHSSNSDMVHLEREEAELLEEAAKAAAEAGEEARWRRTEEEDEEEDELQTSVLSVLGEERELVDLQAPETQELLVSAEEPYMEEQPAEFMQVFPPMALPLLPILKLDPPSTTSTPVHLPTTAEGEELPTMQGLHPPPVLAPMEPEPPVGSQTHDQVKYSQAVPKKQEPEPPKPESSTELPVLLCGGAALVAIIGIVLYGAMAYSRK
ncbi:uncharacterized protein LOC143007610 [Genypterus blacodes]|uniref:uncharacterized protein LOC143007610 n=1 Tax=Genypterus blacodes TaxID=154954 RepID=UPI003F76EB52